MTPQDQLQPSDRVRRVILINSVIGVATAGISTRVFMISLPTLAVALGTDMLGISWALIVYQMAGIGLGVACGRVGDIYGHRKMFGIAMGVMAVGSLLCGFAQNVFQLILFRFVQGVGGAMIQSSGRALAFRAMPAGSAGKAQGLMTMSHQFGFFIGPPIGGLIIDLIHWRGIFFFSFIPGVVGMLLCLTTGLSDGSSAERRPSIDYWGVLLFLGLTILVTMIMDQKIAEVLAAGSRVLLALGFFGLLWVFIAHEKKIASPMIDLSFFSVRVFGFGSVGLLVCCITQGLTTFITPFYLQDVLKLSPTHMGAMFLVPSVLSMVLSPVSGAMTDRMGAPSLLRIGVVILMGAYVIGATLRPDSHWILPTLLLALTGIGAAFFSTPSQAAMIGSLPKEHWGTAIGIINAMFGLGQMLGISLTGIFLTLAFRYYSGIPGTTPNPGDTQLFVSSINVTFLFAVGLSVIPLLTSLQMKKNL